MKINTIEKVNTLNDRKYKFISTKSIATLKLINALTCGDKITVNVVSMVEGEFLTNYDSKGLYESRVMAIICRKCLVEACSFINRYLDNEEIDIYLKFKEVIGDE